MDSFSHSATKPLHRQMDARRCSAAGYLDASSHWWTSDPRGLKIIGVESCAEDTEITLSSVSKPLLIEEAERLI